MNEQTSKKIFFNKSTLLSLKAELLKKQDEVLEKKQKPQHKLENFKPAKASDIEKTTKGIKRTLKDNLDTAVDSEELQACRKSKLALEKKAALYEHLSDGVGNSELAGRFLVDFNTKKHEETVSSLLDKQPNQSEITDHNKYDSDGEWSEFTDCLGRTRRCHISDLEMYKKRDRDLMRIMYKDTTGTEEETSEKTDIKEIPEKPLLVQRTNDYLQSLREKWEEKEQELLAKDKDIHYQDLLFDEARTHGVSYFSFSTDEATREKQMRSLQARRQETVRAQRDAAAARARADALLAARRAAAAARYRARYPHATHVPGLENEDDRDEFTKRLLELLTQQRKEAENEASAEEKRAKEEIEKERQKLREAYVREWDLGKEGVEDKVKKFREMTQEEYVEKQRNNRIHEFAPPQTSISEKSSCTYDNTGRMVNPDEPAASKTWADVRPRAITPPPPDIGDLSKFAEPKGLYFSTATSKEVTVKYRNFVKAQDPVPIENEVSNEEPVDHYREMEKRKLSNHSEIAPPPTYDYYGPVPKQARSEKPFESNIREAFAQGAKSLEPKSSNRHLPQHYDFTFD